MHNMKRSFILWLFITNCYVGSNICMALAFIGWSLTVPYPCFSLHSSAVMLMNTKALFCLFVKRLKGSRWMVWTCWTYAFICAMIPTNSIECRKYVKGEVCPLWLLPVFTMCFGNLNKHSQTYVFPLGHHYLKICDILIGIRKCILGSLQSIGTSITKTLYSITPLLLKWRI